MIFERKNVILEIITLIEEGKNISFFRKFLPRILLVSFSLVLFLHLGFLPSVAENVSSLISADCGEIICRSNGNSSSQLFIIGLSHRDALTRSNGNKTARIQEEVYRIGDRLIHREGVELLLPEGFLANKAPKIEVEKIKAALKKSKCNGFPEMKEIEERLVDDKTYVNAEMLLNEYHPLKLRQVEDEQSYFAVRDSILKLVNTDKDSCDFSNIKSELDYLQERRTATLLQRIPGIVDDEFRQGNIKAKKAIFTIGMAHIPKIIDYLNKGRIEIHSPISTPNRNEDYTAELNLRKANFNVYVIISRTLADDPEVLKMNGLDKIVSSFRRQSFANSSKGLP